MLRQTLTLATAILLCAMFLSLAVVGKSTPQNDRVQMVFSLQHKCLNVCFKCFTNVHCFFSKTTIYTLFLCAMFCFLAAVRKSAPQNDRIPMVSSLIFMTFWLLERSFGVPKDPIWLLRNIRCIV